MKCPKCGKKLEYISSDGQDFVQCPTGHYITTPLAQFSPAVVRLLILFVAIVLLSGCLFAGLMWPL